MYDRLIHFPHSNYLLIVRLNDKIYKYLSKSNGKICIGFDMLADKNVDTFFVSILPPGKQRYKPVQ